MDAALDASARTTGRKTATRSTRRDSCSRTPSATVDLPE